MKEFEPSVITQQREAFELASYPLVKREIDGVSFSYYVVPQEKNPALPDFAMRMTHTDPQTGEMTDELFGVSNSVPETLRDYWALHEVLEFREIGINTEGRCQQSEARVLEVIPEELTHEYIRRRIEFFQRLIPMFETNPDWFSKEDIEEAQTTLALLEQQKSLKK